MRKTVWRQDRDDWMLSPAEWHALDVEFGPFTVDACVAPSRANAFCAVSWSRVEDARVQPFDGHQAWGNLPFSIMYEILVNFLRCKKRQQMGTSGTFLVPVWGRRRGKAPHPAWELILSLPGVFRVVREWREGTHLFTAPALCHLEPARGVQGGAGMARGHPPVHRACSVRRWALGLGAHQVGCCGGESGP